MVKWTAHAKAQLRHIHDYIAQDSPLYAKRVSEAMVQKTMGLDELPRKGHKVPELNEDAVRELGLYSYRIVYEIKPDQLIEVLAVIHKRRHLMPEEIPRLE
ncbi:type II toxin-antitoxin system RelE/ParE family toxin [Alkalimonas sp. MEB108]|uniref:Type II toxin-antitoxin system RelE/ParE family toxin n=1 Tax=Alkalimonas cellulosilytica TaxID=3058395 RepID=A0ABU7J4E9_9GAMM|nr:type II toxin-antitoxin system RelE/ParE family toxin [Alkalimonas sp. MEB108]MEE2001218.1 type II toxin-antitoxin system RelE/ParE family toxin [Alkalimonas sp. MEB108]